MQPSNNFGILRNEYDIARRGYPLEVYAHLRELAKVESPYTLDLGCGTGISTRELIESGFDVVGADKDATMIEVAQKHSPSIKFVVATADQLPFSDNEFDIITAFTAFHWFNNQESLTEIRRVLKPGGVFLPRSREIRKLKKQKHSDVAMLTFAKSMLEKILTERKSILRPRYSKTHLVMSKKNLFTLTNSTQWKEHWY